MEHVTQEQVAQEQVFTREKVIYPLFLLGRVMATGGAMAIDDLSLLNRCLNRHVRGDWGCVCEEDAKTNDEAVKVDLHFHQILSSMSKKFTLNNNNENMDIYKSLIIFSYLSSSLRGTSFA